MKIPEDATYFHTGNHTYYKVEDGVVFFYRDEWIVWTHSVLPYNLLNRYFTKINKELQVFELCEM